MAFAYEVHISDDDLIHLSLSVVILYTIHALDE